MFVNSHPHLGTGDGERLRPTPKAASVQMPTPKADSIQFSAPCEQGMNSIPFKAGPPGPPQAGPPFKRSEPAPRESAASGETIAPGEAPGEAVASDKESATSDDESCEVIEALKKKRGRSSSSERSERYHVRRIKKHLQALGARAFRLKTRKS